VTAIFLIVTPRRSGYVATSKSPAVVAMGATPVEAAENALRTVLAVLSLAQLPTTLILRNDMLGRSAIVVQAIDAPIRLDHHQNDWARSPRTRGDNAS